MGHLTEGDLSTRLARIPRRGLEIPPVVRPSENQLLQYFGIEDAPTRELGDGLILHKLNLLLTHAGRTPFYGQAFGDYLPAGAGLTALEQMAALPVIDKGILRQYNQGFGAPMQIPGIDHDLWLFKTSGTTGQPIPIYRPNSEMIPYFRTVGYYLTHMLDPKKDRVLNLMQHGGGAATGIGFDMSLAEAGFTVYPMGTASNANKVADEWALHQLNVGFIFPSQFVRLTQKMASDGLLGKIKPFEAVLFVGEPFPEKMREFVRGKTLRPDGRVLSYFGNMEAGAIGMPLSRFSEQSGLMHVLPESVYVWVADPDNYVELGDGLRLYEPVPYGTEGILIVTSFNRLHAPIINFNTNDRAVLHQADMSTGINSPMLELRGRKSGEVKIDATWFDFDAIVGKTLTDLSAVIRSPFYQVVITAGELKPKITLRIEAGIPEEDKMRFIQEVRERFLDRIHEFGIESYSTRAWYLNILDLDVEINNEGSLVRLSEDAAKFPTVVDLRK